MNLEFAGPMSSAEIDQYFSTAMSVLQGAAPSSGLPGPHFMANMRGKQNISPCLDAF